MKAKVANALKAQFSNAGGANRLKPGLQTLNVPRAQFINDGDGILGPMPDRGLTHGQIFFANDSMFLQTNFSEPLTNYAVGWRDPNNIQAMAEFIAPPVTVGRRFEWKAAVNAEEFLSEVVDDMRAIGSDFKRVAYTGTDVTDKTNNRGLTYIADLDNVVGGDWQNKVVAKLLRRLYRNRLRRGMTALAAAAVATGYTWDKTAGVSPDDDVRLELKLATDVSGIRPNRVLYGDTAFYYRTAAYGAQNSPAGYLGYTPNAMNGLAGALLVDKVEVSKERYQTSGTAKSEIVGGNVFCFYANDGVDTEDPTNLKCFVSNHDADQGGGLVATYVQQLSAKLVAVTVGMYEKMVVTYAGGIRELTITGPQN